MASIGEALITITSKDGWIVNGNDFDAERVKENVLVNITAADMEAIIALYHARKQTINQQMWEIKDEIEILQTFEEVSNYEIVIDL